MTDEDEGQATEDAGSAIDRRTFITATGKAAAFVGTVGALTYAGVARCDPERDRIRLGVVGGNFGATFGFNHHPDCDVVAVTDLREERRQNLISAYECDNAYDSYELMLDGADDLEAIAIFSEAPAHVEHVRMAAERGLHVLCACPAATSIEDCHELKRIVESSGIHYMQAETSWYRPQTIFARNLYRQGGFGELFYTEAEYYHDKGDLRRLVENKTTRFWNPDGTPSWRWGFPPLMYPTHATGFLVGVTGERVVDVSALGWGSDHPFVRDNVYDNPHWNEASLMRTSGGHMLRCNVFWLVAGDGERAQWFGDAGTLMSHRLGYHQDIWQGRMLQATSAQIPEYWDSDMLPESMRHPSHHGNSGTFITAEFINALMQNRTPEIDLYHSIAMIAPGLVGYESANQNGERLPVPSFDPPGEPEPVAPEPSGT